MNKSTFYSLLLVVVIGIYFGGLILCAMGDDIKIEKVK